MKTTIRAARGSELSCLGWPQEAALRMLQNNLDPEVAEHPDELVVYGGTGKAARDWASFDALTRTLATLKGDETTLPRSIARVLDLFEIVLATSRCNLTTAANASELTPTTALRYLRALEARG